MKRSGDKRTDCSHRIRVDQNIVVTMYIPYCICAMVLTSNSVARRNCSGSSWTENSHVQNKPMFTLMRTVPTTIGVMELSGAAHRRLQLLGRHLDVPGGHSNEYGGASIVLLPCAASSNPVEFYGSRKDSRTLFARQSLEGGATFMRASTWTEVVHQTREAVPRETHPVRNASEKVPNMGTNLGVDASNASVPLFARATLVGSFRDAESARTHRPSPPFAKQPSPGAMVTGTAMEKMSQDDEPPKFAKTAPLKDAKRETAWVPRMDVLESSSAYQVTMELPGVSPNSIRVEINRKWLLVSGVRSGGDMPYDEPKVPRGGRGIYHQREMVEGPYRARWRLPVDANTLAAAAVFSDGVLRIELPKSRSVVG